MPYIRDGNCVYKKNADGSKGTLRGCSNSPEEAKRYMRALYAHETKEAGSIPSPNNLHGPGGVLSMPGQTSPRKKKKKVVNAMTKVTPKQFAEQLHLTEKDYLYAAQEAWHMQSLLEALRILASLMGDEARGQEADNVNTLSSLFDSVMDYLKEQKGELVSAMSESDYETKESSGEKKGSEGHGGYLVTDETGSHLPTMSNGKRDKRLMGAAWAALHGGYRGNKYEGSGKSSAIAKLKKMYAAMGEPSPSEAKEFQSQFITTKEADGRYRWTLITGSAFEDRDGEIIAQKAFERDCDEMELTQDYGELLWWHCDGTVHGKEKEARPYIPLGSCDISLVYEKQNVESGLYYDNELGATFTEKASSFGASKAFFHLPDEPREGVYSYIRTKERSIMPRGKESNLLTRLLGGHKEKEMADNKERLAALKEVLGDENYDKLTKVAKEASQRAEQFLASKEAKKKKPKDDGAEDDEEDMDEEDMPMHKEALEAMTLAQKEFQDKLEVTLKEFTEKTAQRLDVMESNVAQMEKAFGVLMGVQPKATAKELRASQAATTLKEKAAMEEAQRKLAEQSEKAQTDVRNGIESYSDWIMSAGRQGQAPVTN